MLTLLFQTVYVIHRPAVETQDKLIKTSFERQNCEIFQGISRNSSAVSQKPNGNPHIILIAKVVTLFTAYMPYKEQSFGSINIIISIKLRDISLSR